MTTLENRPNTALLVVDVQNGVVEGAHERDAVVANVGSLVEKARREQVPVVWVQHFDEGLAKGSDEWRIVPELAPGDGEPLVEKTYGDSFEDTALEDVLSGLGVGRLVVVGAQTDECIRSTLHGALARGYDATLVSDAHTTEDQTEWGAPPPGQVVAHTNLYWTYSARAGPDGRDRRDRGRRLRRLALPAALARPGRSPRDAASALRPPAVHDAVATGSGPTGGSSSGPSCAAIVCAEAPRVVLPALGVEDVEAVATDLRVVVERLVAGGAGGHRRDARRPERPSSRRGGACGRRRSRASGGRTCASPR